VIDARLRWRLAAAATTVLVLVWAIYKVTTTRRIPTRMLADSSCQSDPDTVADMSQFSPVAAPIRCEPWDIGTGVTGYVWRAPNPRAALLLQHGYAEYAQRYVRAFHQLIPQLLNAGLTVYAFDMWGHGRSPGQRAVTDLEQVAEDHLAARRQLRDQPLFVLGHSLGGLVAATGAARDPEGVIGLILTGPMLSHRDDTALNRFVLGVGGFVLPTMPVSRNQGAAGLFRGAERTDALFRDPLLYKGSMPILTGVSALSLSHHSWTVYSRVTAPALVLHGTADTFTEPEGSRRFIDVISSKDKTLHLVEEGYHELLNDPVDGKKTLEVLLVWLERHLPDAR
jgi:alpha-beta hydrolase superfamily lysophospholipase